MRRTGPLVGALLLALATLPGCGDDAEPASGGSCAYPTGGQPAKEVRPPDPSGVPNSGTSTMVLKTSAGPITLTLDRAKAPCTVRSFESLAEQGYFNQTSCHRLTTAGIFVLQCGDPTGSGAGGPGYSFADEETGDTSYTKGKVAMANSGPDTNGSQFFLVYADSKTLDRNPNYTIFATMDAASVAVVAKVAAAGTDQPGDGRPLSPVTISTVTSTTPAPG